MEEERWMLGWMHLESGMRNEEGRKQRRRMIPKLGLASSTEKVSERKHHRIKSLLSCGKSLSEGDLILRLILNPSSQLQQASSMVIKYKQS